MKLIIDIPDEYYEQILNSTEGSTAEGEAIYAIKNGKPYEEPDLYGCPLCGGVWVNDNKVGQIVPDILQGWRYEEADRYKKGGAE